MSEANVCVTDEIEICEEEMVVFLLNEKLDEVVSDKVEFFIVLCRIQFNSIHVFIK